MAKNNLNGFFLMILCVLCIALSLALAGCSEKETAEPDSQDETSDSDTVQEEAQSAEESETTEQTEADSTEGTETELSEESETTEPELPEEGVQDAGSDITEETLEPVNESETIEAEITDSEDTEELADEYYKIISIKDLKAYPEELHIKVNTTVEWRNVNDKLLHIIGWKGQTQYGVKPEPLKTGESWSYTFKNPGKIVWFSTARPTLQGTIYVEE